MKITGGGWLAIMCGVFVVLTSAAAFAQDQSRPLLWDVTRSVLVDPTTYVPAVISYEAKRRDWKTSQILFTHGWLEANPRFTLSGLPYDKPLSFAEGNRRIRGHALGTLQHSIANNVSSRLAERLLIARFPRHRKIIRVLGWAERISVGAYITYLSSAQHIRQVRKNRELARVYGLN